MPQQHSQIPSSVIEELQRQVLKAEASLEEKEQENAALRDQVQQFESRSLEYEAKMKSVEEMWQKQTTSLQVSSHALIWCIIMLGLIENGVVFIQKGYR